MAETWMREMKKIERLSPHEDLLARAERGPSLPPTPRRPRARIGALVFALTVTVLLIVGLVWVRGGRTGSEVAGTPTPRATLSPVPDVTISKAAALDFSGLGGLVASEEAYGSLWVGVITDHGQTEVVRADPSTGATERTFRVRGWSANEWGGNGIVIGDGAVWIAGRIDGNATIERIEPSTNDTQILHPSVATISFLTFDSEGRLWANIGQSRDGGLAIAELDPQTGQVLQRWPYSAEWAHEICATHDTVWVHEASIKSSAVEGGRLVQVVPGSASAVQTGGTFASPVCTAQAVWAPMFGDMTAMNLAKGIARIDPAGGEVVDSWATDPVGYDIALGSDGGVWFLTAGRARLERLNPSTGRTDVTQPIEGTPIFVVPSDGHIWVGTYEGQLLRYDVTNP